MRLLLDTHIFLCAFRLTRLPLIHRDPFDRILICQALEHGLSLVTTDPVILRYPVPVLTA